MSMRVENLTDDPIFVFLGTQFPEVLGPNGGFFRISPISAPFAQIRVISVEDQLGLSLETSAIGGGEDGDPPVETLSGGNGGDDGPRLFLKNGLNAEIDVEYEDQSGQAPASKRVLVIGAIGTCQVSLRNNGTVFIQLSE